MTITAESSREALKAVIDPEIYQNIVDLGLVYGVEVEPEEAAVVNMTLTTPHCPMGPQIIADVEKTLIAHGAESVTVNVVWDPPWTPDAMTDELKQILGIAPEPLPGNGIEEGESLDNYPDEEPVLALDPPPLPPAKKKGFLGRLFGR